MTAWQDLPPRTRRQARLNEREAQPDARDQHAPSESEQNSAGPRSFHEAGGHEAGGHDHDVVSAYGRRARRALSAPEHGSAPLVPADADAPPSSFRARDFRPEAKIHPHVAFPAAAPAADAARYPEPMRQLPQWSPPSVDHDGELSYFTQAVPVTPPRPASQRPTPQSSSGNAVPAEFAAPPRPMTRRQLRELETSQGNRPQADDAVKQSAAPVVSAAPAVPLIVPAPAAPTPGSEPAVRLAPPIAMPAPTRAAPPAPSAQTTPPVRFSPEPLVSREPLVLPTTTAPKPTVLKPTASKSPASKPTQPAEPIGFTDVSGAAASARVVAAPVPLASAGVAPTADSAAARRGIDFAPEVYTTSTQWPTQSPGAGQGDTVHQPGASFIRTVGTHTGALTTSALVMPSIPQASDITRPFGSTGEILVTGSIDLPRTLGTTGAHPARFDHSDIDALFAAEDHEFAPADSAPVRAIRAVSTHTSTHGVISAKRPASNRLPMMMAVTAGILAVGVAALFAAGMIFGYF